MILDAGCGTGGLLARCMAKYPRIRFLGLDNSDQAILHCRKRGIEPIVRASVDALPFANNSLDGIISVDVLYHSDIKDDEQALKEAHRVLKAGGRLLLHLPAYEFLKGKHDVVVKTRQRYDRRTAVQKLTKSGFRVRKCTYRYMLFLPLVMLKRAKDKLFGSCGSDLEGVPYFLNVSLYFLSAIENRINRCVTLPFGSSVFCIGEKV